MSVAVCLFTDSLEPSGVGEHMLTLAAALRERYRVSFVCPPSPSGLPVLARARALSLETLPLEVRDAPAAQAALRHWLRARRVDVFHGHAGIGWEGHAGVYAARAAGVRGLLRTEHLPDLITDPCQRKNYARLVEVVDQFICVSEAVRASFSRTGVPAHKLSVIRNGISPRPVRPDRPGVCARLRLPPHARLVLTVARLTEQKGHRALIAVIPAVLRRVPTASFVFVGHGPLEGLLRVQAQALGLGEQVSFSGGRDDVPELMAAADLFVLPSLFEGLPLAVLEAMAAGLPVVGTRAGGIPEVVRDGATGRLVDVGDTAALTAAMLEVLERPDVAARWGAAGRVRQEHEFGAARMVHETAAIYEHLYRGNPRADLVGIIGPCALRKAAEKREP
jgi:glycosyltransferase involved in cell wall biosynthesis